MTKPSGRRTNHERQNSRMVGKRGVDEDRVYRSFGGYPEGSSHKTGE